jgi:predicted nucleic acid-binding protein
MSEDRAFIDTNVIVYLFSGTDDDIEKRNCSYKAINNYDCQISTQVINEFIHVCLKKLKTNPQTIQGYIESICSYCDLAYVDEHTIKKALEVHDRYGYTYYDCLIISSALERDCKYLVTEDLHDGQIIENTLHVLNIFKSNTEE